ncbi:unnamed protein product, partial [Closterium sp. NIES-54]
AASLGASESALPGTAPAEALLTFTLDSGAFRCFFRDTTTLTPISAPVPVRLADPSGGPVLARSSTVLPCPALPQVAASAQVSASGPVAAPCSCRLLSHQTLLWHHRLGHPSLPRLRGMHSRLLVSGLPRSLPPLPPSPAPPCLPCIKGLQRAAPHSSFPLTIAPLQTLHMDVWGPACVSGQDRERYVLLVVNDYTRFTTVFPLRNKVLLRPLAGLLRGEGILQSFTLPASPQQNGIAERRIGLVVEVARTSKIHVAAPHFLWLFAVWYAAHQLNLWLGVSFPETLPTLHWTGKVGDASVFRVWGSRAFVRDSSVGEFAGAGRGTDRAWTPLPCHLPPTRHLPALQKQARAGKATTGGKKTGPGGGKGPQRPPRALSPRQIFPSLPPLPPFGAPAAVRRGVNGEGRRCRRLQLRVSLQLHVTLQSCVRLLLRVRLQLCISQQSRARLVTYVQLRARGYVRAAVRTARRWTGTGRAGAARDGWAVTGGRDQLATMTVATVDSTAVTGVRNMRHERRNLQWAHEGIGLGTTCS